MHQKSKHHASCNGEASCGSGTTTDVIEWLRDSGPRSLEEPERHAKKCADHVPFYSRWCYTKGRENGGHLGD